jgi:glycosyltransferase involved in cell wall biosynthesis
MRKKILFIGAINRHHAPENGEEYKNQLLLEYLERHMEVRTIDTMKWKKDPLVIPLLLWHTLFPRYDRILVSASSASVYQLFRFMSLFRRRIGRSAYLVIGGYFPKGIRDGRYKVAAYNGLRSVVVEGESMKKELIALGLRAPVHVIPNFKVVNELWGDAERFRSEKIRFIFISRISESKGFNVIFKALENPVLSHRLDDFTIDFYGPLEKDGREDFEKGIEKYGNCSYSGYLDITNHPADSYRKISGYHVMLFPTYWMGEGFPGVIIDALVCGLPVIASDWNMNREVVTDGKTGRIIPARDADALARMMANVLDNRDAWAKMSSNCHEEARNFDATRVLERDMETAIWP